MANPWAGEVSLTVNGEQHIMKLTLGALAELEARLETGSLLDLVERFEQNKISTRDVFYLLVAGLRGGGWSGNEDDLLSADIKGGIFRASEAAAELLVRAFLPPEKAL